MFCLQADRRQGIDHAGLGVLVIQLDLDRPACGRQIEIDRGIEGCRATWRAADIERAHSQLPTILIAHVVVQLAVGIIEPGSAASAHQ